MVGRSVDAVTTADMVPGNVFVVAVAVLTPGLETHCGMLVGG
jgi:hypothetical protein